MALITREKKDPVSIITLLGDGLLNPALLSEMNHALDTIEASEGPACLVITGEGKSFSTGFDLDAFFHASAGDVEAMVDQGIALLRRLLSSGIPSIAAVNGHAFGIGAMLALACDYRFMRADRGFFCLPEIDLKAPLPPPMTALLKLKLAPAIVRDALLTGKRISGMEALSSGIVDAVYPLGELLPRAVEHIAPLAGKDRSTYASMKRLLHRDVLGP